MMYTVVVTYPPRLEGPTYTALVYARDVKDAITIGQREAWWKQPNQDRGKLSEWRALLVFEGHHQPVYIL